LGKFSEYFPFLVVNFVFTQATAIRTKSIIHGLTAEKPSGMIVGAQKRCWQKYC